METGEYDVKKMDKELVAYESQFQIFKEEMFALSKPCTNLPRLEALEEVLSKIKGLAATKKNTDTAITQIPEVEIATQQSENNDMYIAEALIFFQSGLLPNETLFDPINQSNQIETAEAPLNETQFDPTNKSNQVETAETPIKETLAV
jgi:hypothetical protein